MKYRIYWNNFGYGPSETFESLRDAELNAQEGGFEAVIIDAETGASIGFWSPLRGLEIY